MQAIAEHDDVVERAQVHFGGGDRQPRADDQRDEHPVIHAFRRNVIQVHALTLEVPPIRYSSGNRKIQTMSTKCQYRPATSTGV